MQEYVIVRSNRKSVSITFDKEGRLVVRAPMWLEKARIEELLRDKADAVERLRKKRERIQANKKPEPTAEEQAALVERAKVVLPPLVQKYAAVMNVQPAGITITSARTRWGSCSSKKRLSFTWRLMQMPQEFIEYVVVHELAHIREMNHSPRFWAVVRGVMPDYAQRRAIAKHT